MSAYLTFEGQIEPMEWGDTTFTVLKLPDDIWRALQSGGVMEAWPNLTPGARRGRLHQIETAKRAETRANRITKLVRELAP